MHTTTCTLTDLAAPLRRLRSGQRAAVVCAAALLATAAQAQGQAAPLRLEVEAVPHALQAANGQAQPRDAVAQAAYGRPEDGLRARWWWGRGGLEVGGGADYWRRPQPGAASALGGASVLGLRAALSRNTRLVYELNARNPLTETPAHPATAQNSARSQFALEFKASGGERRALPAGLLRVQLQGGSTLQFRPRGGGLNITYRSRF